MNSIKIKPVKGEKSFSALYSKGKRFYEGSAAASVVFKPYNNDGSSNSILNYTVSIGKKSAKKAVVRNRVKRLLRESIRIKIKEFDNIDLPIDTILINWKKAPRHPKLINLQDVLPVISRLFDKAIEFYNKRKPHEEVDESN